PVAAAAKRLGDGWVHREAKLPSPVGALVALGPLIHVERGDARPPTSWAPGPMPAALARIADQETIHKVLRVREVAINGRDHRQAEGRGVGCHPGHVLQNVDSAVGWYAMSRCGVCSRVCP